MSADFARRTWIGICGVSVGSFASVLGVLSLSASSGSVAPARPAWEG